MTTPFATQSGLMLRRKKAFSDETWQQFAQSLSFVRGALDAPPVEDYARLRESLKAVQAEHHMPDNVLFISRSFR